MRAEGAEAKLQRVRADLAELQSAAGQLSSAHVDLEEARQQLRTKEEAVAALQAALAEKDKLLSQEGKAAASLTKALAQVKTLEGQLQSEQDCLATLQSEAAQLRARAEESNAAKVQLEAECSAAKASLDAKRGVVAQLEARICKEAADAAGARETAEQLRYKNMQLALQLERLSQQLGALEESRSALHPLHECVKQNSPRAINQRTSCACWGVMLFCSAWRLCDIFTIISPTNSSVSAGMSLTTCTRKRWRSSNSKKTGPRRQSRASCVCSTCRYC